MRKNLNSKKRPDHEGNVCRVVDQRRGDRTSPVATLKGLLFQKEKILVSADTKGCWDAMAEDAIGDRKTPIVRLLIETIAHLT